MINRDYYLNQLIRKKENGLVKVITGIRRCGKSYLLFNIYQDYLLNSGVKQNHIITISLDDINNQKYWNPNELDKYIRKRIIKDNKTNYIFIDEIQLVKDVNNPYLEGSKIGFTDVILGLMKIPHADVYVTGSNSEMLSKNILTKFRGKGDQIHVRPLSYKEFYEAYTKDKSRAWDEYINYGGLPFIMSLEDYTDKAEYLKNLFTEIYIKDIMDNNDIRSNEAILNDLLNIISSSIGSLTNPLKLSKTFKSVKNVAISSITIERYLECFCDSFLIEKAKKYDVKGKKYIESPLKYYFTDLGLRNARLNFSEIEETHVMENVIYNELRYRGFNVDVGVLELNYKDEEGKNKRKQLEIDFICNKGNDKIYIQSAFALQTPEKVRQEIRGLVKIKDSFKKIVVVKDNIVPRKDENGIQYVGVEEFLLNEQFTSNN
ncbi:MAG: ATP-binding protein [Mollicutes bacterium]|nr:ATP-binding protein [Mollicutes bacterium]MDD7263417.1 ATP-binding protein [bacterium]MDY4980028.1 ATP-binding protein [Candidatus Onthovivens sp.]